MPKVYYGINNEQEQDILKGAHFCLLIMGKKILKAFLIFHFITHNCKGLKPLGAYISPLKQLPE